MTMLQYNHQIFLKVFLFVSMKKELMKTKMLH